MDDEFIIEKDYKLLLTKLPEQTLQPRGGHNKETIMLNIQTFKRFCVKAGTKKADEIHGRGTCVPPQTPLPNYCGAENQRFSPPF
jgi:hypothetical protein